MRLGFHIPIRGGFVQAVDRAVRTGCEAFQIFSRSPRAWAGKPLDPQEVTAFRRAREEADLTPLAVHLPYLPNLATGSPELREKSIRLLSEELARAEQLGADFLVAHPGHVTRGDSRETAVMKVAESVVQALTAQGDGGRVTFLLENTSGQQGELGD
ncbi:MAG: TIM barrel protein, partial [Deltaproteobacteria bacterium]|nr:TIM barrel protein [Deltaproteobacteria bacterium]